MTMKFRGRLLTINIDGANTGAGKMAEVTVGLVKKEGSTRGKNPRKIEYMAFDQSVPESLPKDLKEFIGLTKSSESELLEYAIDGFNSAAYSAASDEIGEFIPDNWDKETAAQFRLAVRNTSKLTGLDIEATVNMLKPAIEKGLLAKAEALKAKQSEQETVKA